MNHNRPPGVLVTRPLPQAEKTLDALKQNGWKAFHYPAISLQPITFSDVNLLTHQVNSFDWLIFVSQPSVDYFFSQFPPGQLGLQKIAAVGDATKAALEKLSIGVDVSPEAEFNSERLLEQAPLKQVKDKQVCIVRGKGGRDLLKTVLTERGANVDYLEVYQRIPGKADSDAISHFWPMTDVVLCTSNQILESYLDQLKPSIGDDVYLKPIVVISQRMQAKAEKLGFKKIWLAEGPGNDQMVKTIKQHFQLA